MELIQFKELPYLEFKKNETYVFIKNRKYILISKQSIHSTTRVHIAVYREYYESTRCYIEFSLYKELQQYKSNKPPYSEYYEIHSKKKSIQNAMEERALNLILQTIIGDKYYIWK